MSTHAHENLAPDGSTTGHPTGRRLTLVLGGASTVAAPDERRPTGRLRRYLRAAALGQLLSLALLGGVVVVGPGPFPGLLDGGLGQDPAPVVVEVQP